MKKRLDVKRIVLGAMLTAMSVVIGIFCKTALNLADGLFRITFENLPIILSGVMYGPLVGTLVGAASDLISYLLSPQTYPPNLVVTVGAASIGFISGMVARFVVKKRGTTQFIIAGGLAHIIGSMVIKTIGLFQFYSWLVLWRIPLYTVIATAEITVICLLYKNRAIRRLFGGNDEPTHRMTYAEALEYIHSINWTFCKPGLERIEELCEGLGHPERALKFIHVAGTNGKGSTSAMLATILKEAGYKVGLYTSPYIVEFGERMRVDGKNIDGETLARITEKIKPVADRMEDKPTEFELITAIAFEFFREAGVDVVVLECGLGGRLDSTNVITSPLLSIITGIALEHTAILGDTVEKIAYEKAGIIKSGSPVLYGGESDEADVVIRARAQELGSEYTRLDRSGIIIKEMTLDHTLFDFGEWKDVRITLLGGYQPINASIVLSAIEILREGGLNIDDGAVRRGLDLTRWPARFEIVSKAPLIIYDGSHNPEGIRAAVSSVKAYFGEEKLIALTAVLSDKDYNGIAEMLSEVIDTAYTIKADNPRALPAEEYAEVLKRCGVSAMPSGSIDDAVALAYKDAIRTGRALIVLGSLYIYGDVMNAIRNMEG